MEWPLLATLDEEDRRALLGATRVRRFSRGETVVHEGDPADSLHLVERGRLAVRVTTPDGRRVALNVLGPGDYFGELALLDGREPRRSASITALDDAQTRSLPARAFRDLRERHRGAERLLLTLLARRVEELSALVVETMHVGLDRRVCRRLHELTRIYADAVGPGGELVVPLTQELLAELVGGTRPSVNLALQRLVSQRVIELGRGRIVVVDRAALARKAG